MPFFGQTKIRRELSFLIPDIKAGRNVNILLIAPSGHGKTTLALELLNRFGFDNSYISGPPDFKFNPNKRFQFIDEIHMLKDPEPAYPYLDSGDFTFILATNETGSLKEPLINRCIPFIFAPYSQEEMVSIVRTAMGEFNLSQELLNSVASKSKNNPRVAKILSLRLQYVFRNYKIPRNTKELDKIIFDVLDIDIYGYNELERKYLDFLRTVGGTASLDAIVFGTRIDRNTILRDIEPGLLYTGKISIGHGGRSLLNYYEME